jgi:Leucine-rich repeat (LRR) protein
MINILLEKRQYIIQHQNTAQQQLIDILENYSKQATELRIREPLHGDVDFSVLSDFGKITAIRLAEGEITTIRDLPPRITVLDCAKNMLTELPNGSIGFVELNLSHNYLTTIDLENLSALQQLNIADNKLTQLDHLPISLVELDCEQNQLKRLDLGGLRSLKKLNISHNPITIVENLATNIAEFRMDNTPSIEFRHLDESAKNFSTGIRSGHTESSRPSDFQEALDTYFRIKSKYESENHQHKKRIYEKLGALTNRSARKEALHKVAELKPKCIKCKRAVGTVFSKKNNHYLAICGDAANPCGLNIDLFVGNKTSIYSILSLFQEGVQETKEAIIQHKMNVLFHYIGEDKCVQLFNKQMQYYQEESQFVAEIGEKYGDCFNNEHNRRKIVEKKKIVAEAVEKSRGLMTEYQGNGNRELLRAAMQIQVELILPETVMIRQLENEIVEMEKKRTLDDKGVKEYSLFKYPVVLVKTDYLIGEKERVIHMAT